MTPEALVGLLAEPRRLRLLGAIALGTRTEGDLATAAGLTARDAAVALRRLADAGVVVRGADGWTVDHAALRRAARDSRPTGQEQDPMSPFVDGRQLRSLPAQAERRRKVLDHVATTTFVPGQRYAEAEVDEHLRAWCAGDGTVDHAALRRYLVEGGHLVRGSGIYALPSDEPPPLGAGERLVAGLGLR